MWRWIVSVMLAVVGCLFTVFGVMALWMDLVLLDSNGYAETVGALWTEEPVRAKSAEEIAQYIVRNADWPKPSTRSSGQAAEDVTAIGRAAHTSRSRERIAVRAASELTRGPAFPGIWREWNRAAHDGVVSALLRPGGPNHDLVAVFDVYPAARSALGQGSAVDSGLLLAEEPAREFVVMPAGKLVWARDLVPVVHNRGPLVLIGAVAGLLGALALATPHSWSRLAVFCGSFLALCCLAAVGATYSIMLVPDSVFESWHVSGALVETVAKALVSPLRWTLASVAFTGAVVGSAAWWVDRKMRDPAVTPHHPSS